MVKKYSVFVTFYWKLEDFMLFSFAPPPKVFSCVEKTTRSVALVEVAKVGFQFRNHFCLPGRSR